MIRFGAVLALLLLLTACGSGDPAPPPTTGTTTTSASTTTEKSGPRTLAELVDEPCAAITDEQTLDLGVAFDGAPDVQDAHACNWGLNSGVLIFKPYPDSDETAKADASTRTEIAGKPAAQLRTNLTCLTYVTVADGQSIQLAVSNYDGMGVPADPCTVGADWATAIIGNLP